MNRRELLFRTYSFHQLCVGEYCWSKLDLKEPGVHFFAWRIDLNRPPNCHPTLQARIEVGSQVNYNLQRLVPALSCDFSIDDPFATSANDFCENLKQNLRLSIAGDLYRLQPVTMSKMVTNTPFWSIERRKKKLFHD